MAPGSLTSGRVIPGSKQGQFTLGSHLLSRGECETNPEQISSIPEHTTSAHCALLAAGQVHRDGRLLTALINDTELCLCVSETPVMNIQ